MAKKKSVGLLVFFRWNNTTHCLLTRRGKYTWEVSTGLKTQSFVGLCQVTAHGKIDMESNGKTKGLVLTIRRELGEKLIPVLNGNGDVLTKIDEILKSLENNSEEASLVALLREIQEELGTKTVNYLNEIFWLKESCLTVLYQDENVTTYGILLDSDEICAHIPGFSSAGFEIITNNDNVRVSTKEDKDGIFNINDIALFPDELQAIKTGFELF